MKIRSKVTLLLILIFAVFILFSCAKKEEAAPAAAAPVQEPAVDVVEETVKNLITNLPTYKNYMISEADFVNKVKAGEAMFILDVRQPDVYGQGHIKGAVNAPYGPGFVDSLEKIPDDKPVYVYCYTGQTAAQIAILLNMSGFNASTVSFGWNLGISKVEGVAEVTETTPNLFDQSVATKIDPVVKDAVVAFLKGLSDVTGTTWANYMISEDNLKGLIDANDQNIVIVSVRRPDDYAAGHIKGAINIPFGANMYSSFESLPMDKKIVVYCYSGQTSNLTITSMRLLGYDAISMRNGMGVAKNAPNGWANKGFPTVTN